MRRLFLWICPLLLGLASCDPVSLLPQHWDGEILVMQFGYESKEGNAAVGRGFEHEELFQDKNFVAYYDKQSYEEAKKQEASKDLELPYNRMEYEPSALTELMVKAYPQGVNIKKVEVTSSDESVIKVAKVEGDRVYLYTVSMGDAELTVKVTGAKNTVEAVYPMRVNIIVPVKFYITPYWSSSVFDTRVRYKYDPGHWTSQMEEMVMQVTDSVSVVGYCEYYDFNRSRQPLYKRDTIRFAQQTTIDRFRRNHRICLRNVTSAIKEFRSRQEEGNHYVKTDRGDYVLVPMKYNWTPEQVIVDINIVSDLPYIDFDLSHSCYKSFNHIVEDEKGNEICTDTDDNVDDGGVDDDEEVNTEEVAYFSVWFNTFLSEEERSSRIDELNSTLDEYGYDHTLTDEEKDKQLEEINKHYKEGE